MVEYNKSIRLSLFNLKYLAVSHLFRIFAIDIQTVNDEWIGAQYKGNTSDFGSEVIGSTPIVPTIRIIISNFVSLNNPVCVLKINKNDCFSNLMGNSREIITHFTIIY